MDLEDLRPRSCGEKRHMDDEEFQTKISQMLGYLNTTSAMESGLQA